jgi:hypothetical protein
MPIVKNWGIICSERKDLPESEWPQQLIGIVGDKWLQPKNIESVQDGDGCKIVIAGGVEYKVYKKDVNPAYEQAWPGAYKNLKRDDIHAKV